MCGEECEATPSYQEVKGLSTVTNVKKKFIEICHELENRGPSSKLWMQYFEMISIVKEFIRAERMGDWDAHLNSVKKMLPYFHAVGHYHYAKCARIYVQDMEKLNCSMEGEAFEKFTNDFFTIKHSDKYFCGTSSDMVIEQSLMKSAKVQGGFVHGRSTKESVLSKFVVGLLTASNISEGIEKFCGLSFESGDQHVDARKTRIKRDEEDVCKLSEWFNLHNPFTNIQKIMCIATGVTGDDEINSHNALNIGTTMMEKKVGENFKDIKFLRAERVLPLPNSPSQQSVIPVNSHVKVHNVTVPIDPLLMFQRISVLQRSKEELRDYLNYELAPYPLSLFNALGMRKNKKSSFYSSFKPLEILPGFEENATYVIDGGFLLHRIVWHQNDTFALICAKYVKYVLQHFGYNTVIVFDGYSNTRKNVKSVEQLRRSSKLSFVDIIFDKTMSLTVSQEHFLSNINNKSRIISMLTEEFEASNLQVKHAKDDADVLIIETALETTCIRGKRTIVVGEDIDLLVILTARTPANQEIFFLKPGKGKVERKLYSSRSFEGHGNNCKEHVLFIHAFSGCDTTSSIFHKGKSLALKLLNKRQDLKDSVEVFNNTDASHTLITSSGTRFFLALYGAPIKQQSINEYRYLYFTKSIVKNKPVNLSLLPPTASAAEEHLFRVYYQIQKWLGNELNPEEWGWILKKEFLEPKRTSQLPAPDCLLNMIFCNCTRSCGALCGCRKVGLHCSFVCGNCHGQSCLNVGPIEEISCKEVINGFEETEASEENQMDDIFA